jgi:putative NADH-flavin reductase
MKVVVFGATGGTVRRVVGQGLAAGHELTAVVRDPARLPVRHERLEVARAEVLEPAQIVSALAGADAAVSALGPRSYRAPTTVCSASARSILAAMDRAGVRRFVCVSAAPVAVDDPGDKLLYRLAVRPVLRRLLKNSYEDMARMEDQVRRSGLDWTIFRPPRLTDGPRTGRYRTALNQNVPGGYFLSRADLADAILRRLDDPGSVGATVGVGY